MVKIKSTAKQYFEKAYAVVSAAPYSDEYIVAKRTELKDYLEAISTELKADKATALKKNRTITKRLSYFMFCLTSKLH
ncbi:MAG: hypothetical protein ACTH7Q_14705 [Pseudoalteromonas sp.]|uniref:hypothetical protein n=1 Tax=unclassified Pseudoalteromonas TaxID=194690 RepID=UPI003F95195E